MGGGGKGVGWVGAGGARRGGGEDEGEGEGDGGGRGLLQVKQFKNGSYKAMDMLPQYTKNRDRTIK